MSKRSFEVYLCCTVSNLGAWECKTDLDHLLSEKIVSPQNIIQMLLVTYIIGHYIYDIYIWYIIYIWYSDLYHSHYIIGHHDWPISYIILRECLYFPGMPKYPTRKEAETYFHSIWYMPEHTYINFWSITKQTSRILTPWIKPGLLTTQGSTQGQHYLRD